jgi:hypothetical protein
VTQFKGAVGMLLHHIYPENVIGIFMMGFKVEFITNIQNNQNKTRHPDGKTGNIYKRIDFILKNIS